LGKRKAKKDEPSGFGRSLGEKKEGEGKYGVIVVH